MVVAWDTRRGQIGVGAVTFADRSLLVWRRVDNLNLTAGLLLADVEQLVPSFGMPVVWHKKAPNARGLVPVCQVSQ